MARFLGLWALALACGCASPHARLRFEGASARLEAASRGAAEGTLIVVGVLRGMAGRMEDGDYVVDCVVTLEVVGPDGRVLAGLCPSPVLQFSGTTRPLSQRDLFRDAPLRVELPWSASHPRGRYVGRLRAEDRLSGGEAHAEVEWHW